MCLYCENKKENEHFICVSCGIGMCDSCYDNDVEHSEHLFDFHESIEDEGFYLFIQEKVKHSFGYLCHNCVDEYMEQYTEVNINNAVNY